MRSALREILRAVLLASLVAACTEPPPPSASAGPTTPSARPTGAGSPGPSAIASPSTGPLPSFSFVPAGRVPGDLATRATTTREDVNVAIRVRSVPLRIGEPVDVTLTVRNTGDREVRWITDGCETAVDVFGALTGENWIGGAEQTGIAGAFKAAALEPVGHSGDGALTFRLDDPRIPAGAGCADIGLIKTLPAGSIVTREVRWTGDAPIAPRGPAEIVATFHYQGHVGDPEDVEYAPIVARLATWIVSDFVPEFLPPGPAIDVALADAAFADWLDDEPQSTWINTHRVLDRERGTWEIGLFRNGSAGFYGGVVMDARTGEIERLRLE